MGDQKHDVCGQEGLFANAPVIAACTKKRANETGKHKIQEGNIVAWTSSSTADGRQRLRVKTLVAKPWQKPGRTSAINCTGKALMIQPNPTSMIAP